MTRLPVEAESCQTVAEAEDLMKSRGIRHLPVMHGAHLKGIVSLEDILLARIDHGDACRRFPLEKICRHDVLSISPVAPISEVAELMLSHDTDSAVVVDGGFVVGIFTTTDALRVLQALGKKPHAE